MEIKAKNPSKAKETDTPVTHQSEELKTPKKGQNDITFLTEENGQSPDKFSCSFEGKKFDFIQEETGHTPS